MGVIFERKQKLSQKALMLSSASVCTSALWTICFVMLGLEIVFSSGQDVSASMKRWSHFQNQLKRKFNNGRAIWL